jgi:hypothetical protein
VRGATLPLPFAAGAFAVVTFFVAVFAIASVFRGGGRKGNFLEMPTAKF